MTWFITAKITVNTKFALWMFFIMLRRYMVSKTLKWKKNVTSLLRYSIPVLRLSYQLRKIWQVVTLRSCKCPCPTPTPPPPTKVLYGICTNGLYKEESKGGNEGEWMSDLNRKGIPRECTAGIFTLNMCVSGRFTPITYLSLLLSSPFLSFFSSLFLLSSLFFSSLFFLFSLSPPCRFLVRRPPPCCTASDRPVRYFAQIWWFNV